VKRSPFRRHRLVVLSLLTAMGNALACGSIGIDFDGTVVKDDHDRGVGGALAGVRPLDGLGGAGADSAGGKAGTDEDPRAGSGGVAGEAPDAGERPGWPTDAGSTDRDAGEEPPERDSGVGDADAGAGGQAGAGGAGGNTNGGSGGAGTGGDGGSGGVGTGGTGSGGSGTGNDICAPDCLCEAGQTCPLQCTLQSCVASCGTGSDCGVAVDDSSQVTLECAEGATCTAFNVDAPDVQLTCSGPGDCLADCGDAESCSMQCLGPGTCTLDCAGAETCTLDCQGQGECTQIHEDDGALVDISCGGLPQCPTGGLISICGVCL
jgi:hypothetical protein